MAKFHNPYNFVPALKQPNGKAGALGHGKPAGHDKYHDGHWSGRINIKITVATPLIIPTSQPVTEKAVPNKPEPHYSYGLRKYLHAADDDRPLIPVTSFKGALRSAYEAITNSRMGVFQGHDVPPARRMAAREAAPLVPVRFIGNGKIECLVGNNNGFPGPTGADPVHAAWIPLSMSQALPHASPVCVDVQRVQYVRGNIRFKFWDVVAIAPGHNSLSGPKHTKLSTRQARCTPQQYFERFNGYIFRSGNNAERKHDERVFLLPNQGAARVLKISDVQKRYVHLLRNYNSTDGPPPTGRQKSRHVGNVPETGITPGELAYANIKKEGNEWNVVDLYPVMISRELGRMAPQDLLDKSLQPATAFDQLSPADRVFGWVAQKRDETTTSAAWRGQLRIHPIKCTTSKTERPNGDKGVALAILGQPKVAQARFYLGTPDGKPWPLGQEPANDTAKSGYFEKLRVGQNPSKALRGRKVYPHHRQHKPIEYTRASDAKNRADDNQNRSITEWVADGAEFTTSIDVVNLRLEELGALLWLLDVQRWEKGQDGADMPAHLRLGYGKPLGFGSVKVEIDSLDLKDGKAMRETYRSLAVVSARAVKGEEEPVARKAVDAFKTAIADAYRAPSGCADFVATPFIAAWLHAARGFDDQHPIHYPRMTEGYQDGQGNVVKDEGPHPKGENFKWFQNNTSSLGSLVDGDANGLIKPD